MHRQESEKVPSMQLPTALPGAMSLEISWVQVVAACFLLLKGPETSSVIPRWFEFTGAKTLQSGSCIFGKLIGHWETISY